MISLPAPALKFLGLLALMMLLSIAVVGLSGISMLVSSRIQAMDPKISPYGAFGRACALLVVATFFPLLGWFLVAPVLIIVALGVGTSALFARKPQAVVLQQPLVEVSN